LRGTIWLPTRAGMVGWTLSIYPGRDRLMMCDLFDAMPLDDYLGDRFAVTNELAVVLLIDVKRCSP
jgi:hypothetical protein